MIRFRKILSQRSKIAGGMLAAVCLTPLGCMSETRPSIEDRIDSGPVLMENARCEVPGNPANWLAAYCMWMNNVGEFDRESETGDDPVKQCIADVGKHASLPKTLCERNRYIKEQLCQTLLLNGTYRGSVVSCIASTGTVPRVVREGL